MLGTEPQGLAGGRSKLDNFATLNYEMILSNLEVNS